MNTLTISATKEGASKRNILHINRLPTDGRNYRNKNQKEKRIPTFSSESIRRKNKKIKKNNCKYERNPHFQDRVNGTIDHSRVA